MLKWGKHLVVSENCCTFAVLKKVETKNEEKTLD